MGLVTACKGAIAALVLAVAVVVLTPAPAAASRAAVVIDAESGAVLYQRHMNARHYPASLTKMMTLYLLFEALDSGRVTLDTAFPVSARAAGQPNSKLGLRQGQRIRLRDAIPALVIKSANDVGTVVAEGLAGSETAFARAMTLKAVTLGMEQTRFRNATGLPNRRQLTTARDMALLARALYRDFPHYYPYFAATNFRYGGKTYSGHNTFVASYDGADGLKTGYIRASGFNLAASAVRGGRRLVAVVLGANSPKKRDREMASLLDRVFDDIGGTRVADSGQPPAPPPAKPVIAGDGPWAIQVGAFARVDSAYAAIGESLRHIPGIVATAAAVVVPVEEGDGGLFRARFVGVSWREAQRACRILNRKRLDCDVVQHLIEG